MPVTETESSHSESPKPALYNWVRAIKNISLISAIYTGLILLASAILFFISEDSDRIQVLSYPLLSSLISTILLTLGVRSILLQKLIQKFKSTFSFELLLASWCVLLILIHLQCQLLTLMLFHANVPTWLTYVSLVFAALVVGLTWPKLSKIQSLLKNVNV